MILATHAVVGAAVARLFPQYPLIGFFAALASHYFLDSLPHWHYRLHSFRSTKETTHGRPDMVWGRDFAADLFKIALDGLLGVGLVFVLFPLRSWYDAMITCIGIAGGVLPDALQFIYWKLGGKFSVWMQRLHDWAHGKKEIHNAIGGVLSQVVLVALVGLASWFLRR